MQVRTIPYEQVDSVVDTLCEAFYHYPVMRYVIGGQAGEFERHYPRLIRLFVMGRVLSQEPLLGIGDGAQLEAAAAVSLPDTEGISEELAEYRKAAWARLEPAAKARYDAFCEACARFDVEAPHHHLNMIGVRQAHQGKGLARKLIEYVEGLSDKHPRSRGVSLSTEDAANVPFYEHLGFELTGHAEVGPGLETWNFFKPVHGA